MRTLLVVLTLSLATFAQPRAALIRVSAPDAAGEVTITGLAGAVPAGARLAVVTLDLGYLTVARAAADGGFTARQVAPAGSTLQIRLDTTNWALDPFFSGAGDGWGALPRLPATFIRIADEPGAFSATGVANNSGPRWTMTGTIERPSYLAGDTLRIDAVLRLASAGAGLRVVATLTLERLTYPDGTATWGDSQFASTLLTPTGFPIERWAIADERGWGATIRQPLVQPAPNRAEGTLSFVLALPADLPSGLFRPVIVLRFEDESGRWLEFPPEAPAPGFVTGVEKSDTAFLPVIRVGTPAPPRMPWVLLADTPSNGSRGVRAVEDRQRFGFAPRVLTPSETCVVPPGRYSLEPYAPGVTVFDGNVAPVPRLAFRFPSGRLSVRVQKPDGSAIVLGPTPLAQARSMSPLQSGNGPHATDVFQLTTLDPRFEAQLDQYGRHVVTLDGAVADIWGNVWSGGGTYEIHVARPLALDTAVLPGTPFESGDVFQAGVTISPPVPAQVEIKLRQVPNSDPHRALERTVTGVANRFGYFQAPGGLALQEPGEYRVDIVASFRDGRGQLWMGARTWGGVVASRNPAIVAHGRRGIRNGTIFPQWFLSSGVPRRGPADEVFFPFHSGDVMWMAASHSTFMVVTFQDLQGRIVDLLRGRAGGRTGGVESAAALGEIPLFASRPDRLDPHLDPSKVDLWGYSYTSVQRPLIRVRENVSEDQSPGRHYWNFRGDYLGQIGAGGGDRPNDIKFQYGAAVLRGPALSRPEYAVYGSLFVLVPDEDPGGGSRVFPPFQGNGGGPSGGPIMKLKGKDIDLFLHLTGVRPGSVLEVGDTFAVAGAVGPPLPAFVAYAVVTPGGRRTVYSGRANKVGYYYRPEHDFVIDEPGVYTVDLRVSFDGQTSAGQVTEPFPAGDVLGSANGRFYVYAVPRNSAPLAVNVAGQEFSAGAANGHLTTTMPGFLLETRALAGPLRYRFDPVALARDFPNLDVPLADVVTISLFANHQARVLVYHGEEFFQTDQTPVVAAPAAVVNAATFTPGPVAPGSLATLFGANLASVATAAPRLPLPATLGGATLRLNGIAAPLLYASPGQINFQVPWELTGQTRAALEVSGGPPLTVNLAAVSPGIFAVAPQGRFLTLYCTGLGAVTNRPASGAAAPGDPLSVTTATPAVTAGGVPARVLFSGLAPGFAGLYQVNVEMAENTPFGDAVPVQLTLDGVRSNTLPVKLR
jgi:uncharacterized protein (TIGR03437 family)